MVRSLGLPEAIHHSLALLKYHVPYYESDHVLNIAYNVLCGGQCLEDLEDRRQDEAYVMALGAERVPDPTTAGDFCRRFDSVSIRWLMDAIQSIRKKVWSLQDADFFREAIIDIDGTIASGEAPITIGAIAKNQVTDFAPWKIARDELDSRRVRELVHGIQSSGRLPRGDVPALQRSPFPPSATQEAQ